MCYFCNKCIDGIFMYKKIFNKYVSILIGITIFMFLVVFISSVIHIKHSSELSVAKEYIIFSEHIHE